MPSPVFISYSHTDTAYVTKLVAFLRKHGVPVWVDEEIDYGHRWQTVIRQRVDTCSVFVPVMTSSAEDSPWVSREILRAEAKDRPIVPLLLAGDVFFRLADLQYEDVRQGEMPGKAFIARLRRLVEGIGPHTDSGVRATPRLDAQNRLVKPLLSVPVAYGDARKIGESVREGTAVVLDLRTLDEADAKRLVDFGAGLAFGVRGTIERITHRIFLIMPSHTVVSAEDKLAISEGLMTLDRLA